ncbi:MAG: zinc ribbon domain-containing protein [Pyrinomonadaceae bacterium]|nr:zinc ribbon domain-containing protein [Pyrinomonadaceae bacterium]
MFCPECGIEDHNANQFCRACGVDLRRVRSTIEMPDSITASAATAREEIGRAIASKIREARGSDELAVVAEEVLPEIEKFLESPAEKRLRRMRTGVTIASIGLGVTVAILFAASFMVKRDEDFLFILSVGGIVTLFIGLGFLLNGFLLTVPKTDVQNRASDAEGQRILDSLGGTTNDLKLPEATSLFSSVTEETTTRLKEKIPASRR